MYIQCKYTLQVTICTKSIRLVFNRFLDLRGNFGKVWNCLNFIRKRRIFFCLTKLLFIKVGYLTNVNVRLEANLEDKGGKQHCLPFVCFNL